MIALQTSSDVNDTLTQSLCGFRSASTALLGLRKLTTRSDWKFIVPSEKIPELFTCMQRSHAILPAGDVLVAQYHSRYYDTAEMQCYQDHRRGKPQRFKLRHRHYCDRSLSMFEVKAKNPRGNTRKARMEVPFTEHGGTLDAVCREFAEQYLNVSLDGFEPSLDNRFNRITLLGLEAEERITVDFDLSFSFRNRRADLPGFAIVEVKSASPRHLTPTLLLLSRTGLRPQGMSKYCAGVTLLEQNIPPSWFAGLRRRIALMSDHDLSLGAA